jgi:hypothetical protein
MVKADGEVDTESEAVKAWVPAFENYRFAGTDGDTEVQVEMDVAPDWEGYMQKAWPKALARLKTLCEA